jgi:hypothetical protein
MCTIDDILIFFITNKILYQIAFYIIGFLQSGVEKKIKMKKIFTVDIISISLKILFPSSAPLRLSTLRKKINKFLYNYDNGMEIK